MESYFVLSLRCVMLAWLRFESLKLRIVVVGPLYVIVLVSAWCHHVSGAAAVLAPLAGILHLRAG